MYTLVSISKTIPCNFTGTAELEGSHKTHHQNGKLHRLEGPALEYSNGHKEYWVDGKRHRLDGPAIEYHNSYRAYWVEGKLHRLDGPAIEYSNGNKEYYVEGVPLTKEDFLARVTKTCSKNLNGLTVEIEGKKTSGGTISTSTKI